MRKMILIIAVVFIAAVNTTFFAKINNSSGFSLENLIEVPQAQSEISGWVLLEKYGKIRGSYMEGPYYYPSVFGCKDANSRCYY
jgi:hypothetical protein